MGKLNNITGQTFGRLTVAERVPSERRDAHWRCVCTCRNEIVVRADHLRSGHTRSCGCLLRKGDDITYKGAHNRVVRVRGSASGYMCARCLREMGEVMDWAVRMDVPGLQHAPLDDPEHPGYPYHADPAMYLPMCRQCHFMYDFAHGGRHNGRFG